MRILITGSRGMLGTAIIRALKNHELITPYRYELNVSNINQVKSFKKQKPDVIIHLASETDHEYCQENPSQCYFVNTIGTGFMTDLARSLDIPIIYQSTASIFDGIKGKPYLPTDKPNPINHYNTSKYYGELIVQGYEKHIILRSGWMFGGGRGLDKKFVWKIIKKIEAGLNEISVCNDCIGSPTYSLDLADVYKYIVDKRLNLFGTFNAVNHSDGVSRYEFAKEIVKILNIDVEIIACKIDQLKDEFPCLRTNYEVLENGITMPEWKGSLKGYILANYRH